MKSGQIGTIGVAVSAAVIAALLSSWVSDSVYVADYLEEPAYEVDGADEPVVDLVALRRNWPQALGNQQDRVTLIGYMSTMEPSEDAHAEDGEPEAPEIALDLDTRLSQADLARGEQLSAQCQACHSFEEGGAVRLGPTLYGVAGRGIGGYDDFDYSDVMADYGGDWTLEELDTFLADPLGEMPGTRMIYVGVPQQQERADIIAYLNTVTGAPLPMPAPVAAPAEEAEEAEGEE
jgi:cytochrome c